jgi:hypothetical protein
MVCSNPPTHASKSLIIFRKMPKRYYSLLERGVAIHHGGLPLALRKETELRIYDGRVRLLFASPTLAQGVNIPFDTVLVYRLRHQRGIDIHDPTFWNVVGRVGRPTSGDLHGGAGLHPPKVIFLSNRSPQATIEDKIDNRISKRLVSRQSRYRVASPFLKFLIQLRKEWKDNTGQPIAALVTTLAERPDLQWIARPKVNNNLSAFLRVLDEHLIALAEESGEEADDWLQTRVRDVIELFVQATTLEAGDLDFIRDAVLARARFVINHIPKERRRQDYLLGLPHVDCVMISENQDKLLEWYQGCTDIFARRLESGIENLIQILDFVWGLSICPKKWGRDKLCQLPPMLEPFGFTMPILWMKWIQGKDMQAVTSVFEQLYPGQDFNEYCQDMLEGCFAWGLSAICKFLGEIAQDNGLSLTKDLEFLPSLVKYGVPGKLPCYLVRLKIPREAAVNIAELYGDRMQAQDFPTAEMVHSELMVAKQAIVSLSAEDIASLAFSDAIVERIKEIHTHFTINNAPQITRDAFG